MNKAKAGYCMLMILSEVDHEVDSREREIINNYVEKKWPQHYDNDACDKMLAVLGADDLWPKYIEMRDLFYNETDEIERNEFLQFAMDLVKADEVITEDENRYLKCLFDTWDPNND